MAVAEARRGVMRKPGGVGAGACVHVQALVCVCACLCKRASAQASAQVRVRTRVDWDGCAGAVCPACRHNACASVSVCVRACANAWTEVARGPMK